MLARNIKYHQAAPARKMRIKKPYYDAIMSGRKTLEVRVGYGSIKRLRAGELLQLETSHESGAVRIKSIRIYDNFAKMLAVEDWRQIVPQAKDRAEEHFGFFRKSIRRAKKNLACMLLKLRKQRAVLFSACPNISFHRVILGYFKNHFI